MSDNDSHKESPPSASTDPTQQQQEQHDENDEVIGLQFINGRIFYLYRSTWIQSSDYLRKRFANDDISCAPRDMLGRKVYFMQGDSSLFENHILPFILTKVPGKMPPFSQDRTLWRQLRKEADKYQLDGLADILYITQLCSPTNELGRGVFYYLGTDGNTSHWKPNALGMVEVRRDARYLSSDEQEAIVGKDEDASETTGKPLVQYQPSMPNMNTINPSCAAVIGWSVSPQVAQTQQRCCRLFSCSNNNPTRVPTVVVLRFASLRLVAYSLSKDAGGMTKWTVEASENGDDWKVLHAAPGNDAKPTFTQKEKDILRSEMSMIKADIMVVPKEPDPLQKVGIVLDQAEKSRRKVWKIKSPSKEFYKYFRIVAIGDNNDLSSSMEQDDDSNGAGILLKTKRELNRVGFELFGEIHED